MKRLVIEASRDGKKWEELYSFSNTIISPSKAISVKGWEYIRLLIKE